MELLGMFVLALCSAGYVAWLVAPGLREHPANYPEEWDGR